MNWSVMMNIGNIFSTLRMQQEMESLDISKIESKRLSTHHGKADVERSLSNKKNVLTKERTSLSEETLIGLQRCKQY